MEYEMEEATEVTKDLADENNCEGKEDIGELEPSDPIGDLQLRTFDSKRKKQAPEEDVIPTKKLHDEATQLCDSIFLFTDKKMTPHGNVFEGEIRSGVFGVRPCAIKFARKNEDNVREAKILAKLSSHTYVVSIIQSGIYKDLLEEHVYIALDRCYEQNLRQYFEGMKQSGVVYDVNVGLEYSKQIIAGMKYVHENLIFHKDLKTSNILLTHDKTTIKLADFGLSEELKSTSSKVFCKHQFGTIGFRPAESFGKSWASLKSDIFSLGVIFYSLLSDGKSPFGDEIHLWTYNTKKGVFGVSGLLVPNPECTEHLIKLMLNHERCSRPSIWQVAEHPCWIGKEAECDFDYGYVKEIEDSEIEDPKQQNQGSDDDEREIKSTRAFLKVLKDFGYGRPPSPKTSITVFDFKSQRLQRFNMKSKTVTPMHEFNEDMKRLVYFTSVSIGNDIFVLMGRLLYRLKYRDDTATWERMPDLIDDHGERPPAIVASGEIIIAGGSENMSTASVSRYHPSLNRWNKVKEKPLSTKYSASVAARGYIYCIGGIIKKLGITAKVERMNMASQSWDEMAPMQKARTASSAVECGRNIFVAGGENRELFNSVEKYVPDLNQWTTMKPMTSCRFGVRFRCHLLGGNIYAVGHHDKGIEKYDVERDEWEVVQLPDSVEFFIQESVVLGLD